MVPKVSKAENPDWWRGAVIYQIYPRSYQDSNGDGIGDLLGIVQRLPYIASLGVDAIWISPFFTSPMKDFGYDVSDYCDVDPMFGSLADFDAVIETAHFYGIKVMIDLVMSHTSDQHPWFIESRESRDNPKADWYVWSDPKDDGTPPNNWLSIFGGPAWQWDAGREQYYLHNFLVSQPDLNFHNPDVQDAVLSAARFWLERGVDGFRLDTINFYFHDAELRSNPALPKEERKDTIAPSVNPYNHQRHIYSKNRPENLAFLKKFRELLDEFPGAATVGEVGDAQRGLEIMGEYTRKGEGVHMCYAFEFLENELLTPEKVVRVMNQVDDVAAEGWACWAFSNHDVMRHASRWNLPPAAQRLYISLMISLRGSVCLYQGEELGLHEADVAFEDLQDPYGIQFWPEFKGRDGCRTPMVWDINEHNAGFSNAARPWLPVSGDHANKAVAEQEKDPSALLHHYRRVIGMRHAHQSLVTGDHADLKAEGTVLSFRRVCEDEELFCAFNMSDQPATIEGPVGNWHTVNTEMGSCGVAEDGKIHLGPWQPSFLVKI
ncbi:MAG: alpha-amylase family glycosyl hydrolase [Donghicola eburneus]|nr:alpha-amylase family glycosyl hydrolase [Donghicola eburneus]MCI5041885.1 alpha-amylase family glycosyl hydrolase [Donghicola eburneus]